MITSPPRALFKAAWKSPPAPTLIVAAETVEIQNTKTAAHAVNLDCMVLLGLVLLGSGVVLGELGAPQTTHPHDPAQQASPDQQVGAKPLRNRGRIFGVEASAVIIAQSETIYNQTSSHLDKSTTA
jgi:hypothetical protein